MGLFVRMKLPWFCLVFSAVLEAFAISLRSPQSFSTDVSSQQG